MVTRSELIVRAKPTDDATFSLHVKVKPDVWQWAVLFGDALHNLRCALDHMVYALAIHETGAEPPDDDKILAFPVCSDSSHFAQSRYRIRSLSTTTQAAIERAQPYNRPKPGRWFAPIWWLAQLNDVDKHRLAHLSLVAARDDEIVVDAEPGSFTAHWNTGPLIDGAPFFVLTLSEPNPEVYVELRATAAVVLSMLKAYRQSDSIRR